MAVPLIFGQETKQSSRNNSTDGSATYRQAQTLLKNQRPAEALNIIRTGLAGNPSDWKLYDLRGRAESSLGNSRQAEASFRKAIELAPEHALGYADLGVLMLQTGRTEEAEQLFHAALNRDPNNFIARLGLGTTLLDLKQTQKAATNLMAVWDSDPGNFQAGYEYALTLRELKRPKEARSILSKIVPPASPAFAAKFYALSGAVAADLEDWHGAVRDYSRAYHFAPEETQIYSSWVWAAVKSKDSTTIRELPPSPAGLSPEQHFSLGILFASVGSFAKAVPEFKTALKADPANDAAAYNLALSYQQLKQPLEATAVIQAALRQKPGAALYNLLATLEEGAGDYVQAARDFRQAVDLDSDNEEYYFDLGVECLSHYAFRPALDVFEVANQKFPGSLREKVGLGYAHYGLHQYPEAEQAFLEALEINPSAPAAFAAWNTLMSFLTPSGYQELSARLRRLAEGHPASPESLYYCGVSLFRSGEGMAKPADLKMAQDYLERALNLKPEFSQVHFELGRLYLLQSAYENAAHQFLETIRIDPQSANAHYQLGVTYRKLGHLAMAQQQLAQYSALSQEHQSQMSHYQGEIKKFIVAEKPGQK
ncbi:MAG TPA: tetratricopeptide repeat protein [Terriglobia bacterium]|nr:tetratricopeptide repeat protein [Terriglobia bacterium]